MDRLNIAAPQAFLIEPLVRAALAEDLGRAGDLTTDTIVPKDARVRGLLNARKAGVVAGLGVATIAFRLLDPDAQIEVACADGTTVGANRPIATVSGRARALLTAERVALNFLCHLSGVATATREIVDAVAGYPARIACTRKTTPGLRALEKYAVRLGGGVNHRFGLDDGVLLKDNHIVVAGGIRAAIEKAKASLGHMVKVEVEVDHIDQLGAALAAGADAILLDNMTPAQMREAVAIVDGGAIVEASGRITAETAAEIAATGVDVISCGWITHSAPILDIGLDFEPI
ncbi:MAG TPA: carboxylating nicotinate-nucleotide diphosphorylase [Stellaceae bacterium]|nr:carboxylating nicotinate-nucleotide diphosphorylase [Stellaceae bacterium]